MIGLNLELKLVSRQGAQPDVPLLNSRKQVSDLFIVFMEKL